MGILGWNFKKLMSCLKSASSNLLTCNVLSKNKKTLNLGPKIPYLGIFGLQFNKNYYQIFNQYSRICETIKFHPKPKKNLGPKMLYWVFGLECSKTIVIFVINALQFVQLQSFVQKLEFLNLGPKMPKLGVFGLKLENTIVIIEISSLEFVLFQSLV